MNNGWNRDIMKSGDILRRAILFVGKKVGGATFYWSCRVLDGWEIIRVPRGNGT